MTNELRPLRCGHSLPVTEVASDSPILRRNCLREEPVSSKKLHEYREVNFVPKQKRLASFEVCKLFYGIPLKASLHVETLQHPCEADARRFSHLEGPEYGLYWTIEGVKLPSPLSFGRSLNKFVFLAPIKLRDWFKGWFIEVENFNALRTPSRAFRRHS